MQVQKDAPVEFLLGTDLLPQLGFTLLESSTDGTGMDLLQSNIWRKVTETEESSDVRREEELVVMESSETESTEGSSDVQTGEEQLQILRDPTSLTVGGNESQERVGVVRLLQAVRLPARHQKLLRARVDGLPNRELALFEPDSELRKKDGLNMAEAILEPDASNTVTLVLENAGCEALRLKKGRVLRMLQPVQLVSSQPVDATDTEDDHSFDPQQKLVGLVRTTPCSGGDPERAERLTKVLQLENTHLTPEQREDLKQLLLQYPD